MTTAVHPYVESLLTGTRELPKSAHAWLNARRGEALERANALSVPTTRDEEWRFTDLTPLTRLQLRPVDTRAGNAIDLAQTHPVPEAGARLVFVDGIFAPALSAVTAECGVRIGTLADMLSKHAATLEAHLARLASFERSLFAALNTAHLRDAAVVIVPKNAACEKPVHVVHLATQPDSAAYPRCLFVAEAGAECTFVEDYSALTPDAYLTNSVTEIAISPDARIRHVKIQGEGARGFHIGTCAVRVAKDATYSSQTISLGARLSRYDLTVELDGEGAAVQIDGLALISGRQLADTHTTIDHVRPNCRSVQLHKTIVGEAAHAVFNGKIHVRPGAQLTDSAQQSRNLLLSDRARIDVKPQLEIFADDVKCAHGATVGQLDPEQLFYLRSRGLPDRTARNLLTYAFGASVIERIPVRSVVERLRRAVMAQTGATV
jgi:Fe-S cluster assembly protein SufD